MSFNNILASNFNSSASIALVKANSLELLSLVRDLAVEKQIEWHLFDDEDTLINIFNEMAFDYTNYPITIHHSDDDKSAAHAACRSLSTGETNVLMKGLISSNVILKAVLNKEYDLLNQSLLSHVSLLDVPNYHKPIILSDAGMNIEPDIDKKIDIIKNTITVAHMLGIERPKVALISAVEKVNEKIASTVTNDIIVKSGRIENAIVDGPMQYDLAMSSRAAEIKQYDSPVAGDADILIMPHIDAGNILYKALITTAGAHGASIIVGLKVPFILTSRADSRQEKYNSIKLALKILTH